MSGLEFQHPPRTTRFSPASWALARILWRGSCAVVVLLIEIVAPFPDVAVHVAQSPRIGLLSRPRRAALRCCSACTTREAPVRKDRLRKSTRFSCRPELRIPTRLRSAACIRRRQNHRPTFPDRTPVEVLPSESGRCSRLRRRPNVSGRRGCSEPSCEKGSFPRLARIPLGLPRTCP